MPGPRRIGAIEVGFRIVRVLEAADGPMALKELSDRAGMPPSKAYAYVASFVHEGLIAQDPESGQYGLGPFAMSIGVAALRQSDLVDLVRRESAALSAASTSSVILSMWGNRGPTIVHRFDGKRRGPTSIRVGYVAPVWASATGRVFVAYLPEAETEALLVAEEGAAARTVIAAECTRIRSAGYALGSADDDLTGIAAPIRDHSGTVVAVLTLSRPFENNTLPRRRELGSLLVESVDGLSRRLGYPGTPAKAPPSAKGGVGRPGKVTVANSI
jgi:DNA-binding IclR family transcriptional regulator